MLPATSITALLLPVQIHKRPLEKRVQGPFPAGVQRGIPFFSLCQRKEGAGTLPCWRSRGLPFFFPFAKGKRVQGPFPAAVQRGTPHLFPLPKERGCRDRSLLA